jgi:subtilisin family serine protease
MKHGYRVALLAAAFAAGACADAPTASRVVPMPEAVSSVTASENGRYLVLLRGSASAQGIASRVAGLGGAIESAHDGAGIAVVSDLTVEGAGALLSDRSVAAVVPDVEVALDVNGGSAEAATDVSPSSPANPALAAAYARQWHLRAIGADVAWAAGRLGSNAVSVAILDSGIDPTVPDLVGRVDLSRSTSFVPLNSFDEFARSVLHPAAPTYTDMHFHGTHVAATVSSNALITAGVTSGVTLFAVKVLGLLQNGNASGSFSGILNGVLYAADQGADVANMSLGGAFLKQGSGQFLSLIQRVFNYANQRGMTVVVAAGNSSWDLDHFTNVFQVPCDAANVICVSATGPTNNSTNGPWQNIDAFASYSNYGRSAINVAAPGGNASFVWAPCSRTSALIPVCSTGNFIIGATGTSMASPHVAGLAALLVEHYGRNPARIKAAIQQGADDLGQPGTDPFYGKGRINVPSSLGL